MGWMEALAELGCVVHPYNLGDRLLFYDTALQEASMWTPGEKEPEGGLKLKRALPREAAFSMAGNGILSTCFQFWPDVVLMVSAFYMPPGYMDIIRTRPSTRSGQKMRVVLLHTESPYQDDEQLERAAHADLNLVNDPMNLDAFRELGIPAYYMPHAYRPGIHNPGPGLEEFETDLSFIGTGFPSRIDFFERMLASGHIDDLDITLGGNWQGIEEGSVLHRHLGHELTECVRNDLTAMIYRSSKCGINFYRKEGGHKLVTGMVTPGLHSGLAVGPREIEMAACGLFFLREPRPESDELLPMLPVFGGPEDAAEQIAWWVKHDDERYEAALKARAAVRDRTFLNSAKQLMEYLGE